MKYSMIIFCPNILYTAVTQVDSGHYYWGFSVYLFAGCITTLLGFYHFIRSKTLIHSRTKKL